MYSAAQTIEERYGPDAVKGQTRAIGELGVAVDDMTQIVALSGQHPLDVGQESARAFVAE